MFTGSEERRVSSSGFNSPQMLSYDLGGNTPCNAMQKFKVRNGCRPVRVGSSHFEIWESPPTHRTD
jgi:hypothetical protein